MNKKLISMTVAAAMVASCGAVMAEEKTPTVYVNSSEIMFEDQTPVILGEGTTLIPARGVFEAMGAKVDWKEETREVEVESADHKTLVRLTIDDSTMKVFDLSGMLGTLMTGQDFDAPQTDVTLDVAPQIINDRTMIPLRAISEAINANVEWDGEAYAIDITTADAPSSQEGLPAYSLSTSALSVNAGENVDIYINVENLPEGTFVSGVTAAVKYNKENFEFIDATLINGDTVIEGALGVSNPDFGINLVKTSYVTIDIDTAVKADGAVMKLTFKSINGQEGAFELSDSYHTKFGYNTSLLTDVPVSEGEQSNAKTYDGDSLKISTEAVIINAAADVPAATVDPTATTEPTATADPTATVEPTAQPAK